MAHSTFVHNVRISTDKTFTVRMRMSYDRPTWQVGQDICADAGYYTREFAIRCMDKFTKRGMSPVFENGATDPHEVI